MSVANESAYLPSSAAPLPTGPWLILAPHPDDETFGMGGSLLLAKEQQLFVEVIFLTDGGQGGDDQAHLVATREREARQVAEQLGIHQVHFWQQPDRELQASTYLIDKLAAYIRANPPATVFFPSPLEPHPDHRTTAVLAWEGLRNTGFAATPVSYDISVQSHTNYLIDISRLVEEKRRLMAAYQSQLSENAYIERIIALNQSRTWTLPKAMTHAESFYLWPKENRPLNALLLELASKASSLQALPAELPLISVITRTLNRPDFLRKALRSVAAQSYPNIELIVVNDGGPSCAELVEQEAVGSIKQVHYLQLPSNVGRSAAANAGLDRSTGEFLIFLDDDDYFAGHHILSLYEQLTQHGEAIAAYAAVRCVNEQGELTRTFASEFDPIQLCLENFIPIHAVLFRRRTLAAECRFDEQLDFCEDWDFWLQVQQHGRFVFIPEIGATYRIFDSGSGLWDDPDKTKAAMLKVYKKWLLRWNLATLWSIFDYARQKQTIAAKDQKIAEQRALLAAKTQEMLEKDRVIATHRALHTEKDQVIATHKALHTEKDRVIEAKNRELMQQQHLLGRNEQELQQQQTLLDAANRGIAERDTTISQLEQTQHALYTSHSWRITAPLRRSKQLLTGNAQLMKKTAYFIWRRLPLTIQQRIHIKNKLLHRFPALPGLLGVRSEISAAPHPQPPQATATSEAAELYYDEYYLRFDAAVNNTPLDYVPIAGEHIDPARTEIKVIAFYLPQFHPIPENDREWGKGFTEWTNVSKAVPQFVGHYQPRLPGELGFYDLRLKDVQQRQIELAKQYGIDAFCYHHYWFGGKRVLERPFQQILDDPGLDLPFCLCWANENWTRRWDGGDNEIILQQQHSPEDDIAFIEDIAPALKDPRYVRIDGKPLLIVYRPGLLPDPAATAKRWRHYARDNGIGDLHIVSAATFGFDDFRSIDYDGLVQFPPHNIPASDITDNTPLLNQNYQGHVFDYPEYARNAVSALAGLQHTFPCVMMNWDNEARKPGRSHTFQGATPKNYKTWLNDAFTFVRDHNAPEERVVFINAWNEWAEGTYLEPDRRYGYAYLHASADIIRQHYTPPDLTNVTQHNAAFKKTGPTAFVIHWYYPDLLDELLQYVADHDTADYFINLPAHIDLAVIERLCTALPNAYISVMPNKGRDILPFIRLLDKVVALGYDYVLKLHSKKSLYRKDGTTLRTTLFDDLLGKMSPREISEKFREDASLGLIAPGNSIVSLSDKAYDKNSDRLKNNLSHLQTLLQRSGNDLDELQFDFIAGSMFWARVAALKPLLDLQLSAADFEEELGQTDGTMAHAVERIFSFLAAKHGYKTVSIDSLSAK